MKGIEIIQTLQNSRNRLIKSSDELNIAIDHIVQLFQDSSLLYNNKSYSSSVFLSITACEEIAKAHIGIYSDGKSQNKKGRNIFKDHKSKHMLAALPTVEMGKRLVDSLGKSKLQKLMRMANNSGFTQLRESAIYFQFENNNLVIPKEKIDKDLARSLLLFSIESFDDALVGVTSYSFHKGEITDVIFEKVASS